ncbi:hypothetical protein ACWIGI_15625 [Nocardia sp. NPDC055321]
MKHNALRYGVAAFAVAGATVAACGPAAADIALVPAEPAAVTVADEPATTGSTNNGSVNSLSSGASSLVPPKLLPDLANSASGQAVWPTIAENLVWPLRCMLISLSGTTCGDNDIFD